MEFNVLFSLKKIVFAHASDIRTSVGEEGCSFTVASTASDRLIHREEDVRQANVAGAHK